LLLAWRRARWIAVVLATIFVGLTLANANPIMKSEQFGAVGQRLSTLTDPTRDSLRPEIWSTAIEITTENPIFGVGVNQFQAESAQRGLIEEGTPLENAHSVPLGLAAETGIVGLCAFLVFVVQLGLRAIRAMGVEDVLSRPLALGIAAALLAFLIQGLTASQLRTNLLAGAFFVFAGMITGLADRARESEPSRVSALIGGRPGTLRSDGPIRS